VAWSTSGTAKADSTGMTSVESGTSAQRTPSIPVPRSSRDASESHSPNRSGQWSVSSVQTREVRLDVAHVGTGAVSWNTNAAAPWIPEPRARAAGTKSGSTRPTYRSHYPKG
jgi:hypothetical protein